jgi:hypothetical protein
MTKETVVGSLTAPGSELNDLGYIATPDKIYELCALSYFNQLSLSLSGTAFTKM